MKQAPIVESLAPVLEPVLDKIGLELVDIEFKRDQVGQVLRVFIDRPGGVDLDTCARASEAISGALDELDIIQAAYSLEVSSPGVERPLTKLKDFQRFIGSKVSVKTMKPAINGRRKFTGILKAAGEEGFEIEVDKEVVRLSYEQVKKAHLVFEF